MVTIPNLPMTGKQLHTVLTDISNEINVVKLASLILRDGALVAVMSDGTEVVGPVLTGLGGPVEPAIDAVVVLGASIMFAAFGHDLTVAHPTATTALATAGHSIPVYGWATSGVPVVDAVNQYTAARAAFPNALILMHLGGNSVSSGRPYPGGVGDINTGLSALLAVAAGDKRFYPASITFRDYDDLTFQDPSRGSKPYNENVFIPWIAANFPHAMASYGRPKLDFYRRTLQSHDTWLSPDNVHMSTVGTNEFRAWIIDRVADLLSGVTPAEITERVYTAPVIDPTKLSIINFKLTAAEPVGYNNMSANATVTQLSLASIKDVDGGNTTAALNISVPNGTNLGSTTDPGFGGGQAGRTNAPAYNKQLLSGEIISTAYYVTPTAVATMVLSGLVPNGNYEIGFLGSRAATDTRMTKFTVQGTVTEWNATEDPVQERKVTVAANASGEITMSLAAGAGSAFGYLSGLSFRKVA